MTNELRKTPAVVCKCALIDDGKASDPSCETEMLAAGRIDLDAEGLAALKQATPLGYQPLPGEK